MEFWSGVVEWSYGVLKKFGILYTKLPGPEFIMMHTTINVRTIPTINIRLLPSHFIAFSQRQVDISRPCTGPQTDRVPPGLLVSST